VGDKMTFPNKPGIKHAYRVTVKGITNVGGINVPANTKLIIFRQKTQGFVSIPSLNKVVSLGEI
jgi:hypothetical protein